MINAIQLSEEISWYEELSMKILQISDHLLFFYMKFLNCRVKNILSSSNQYFC